jgi:hypothetical protein
LNQWGKMEVHTCQYVKENTAIADGYNNP